MNPSGIVTLLSDFGLSEPFVGVMKGVVLRHFPAAKLVDLSHAIGPQDVGAGAFWLAQSAPFFPPGTVHLAVVDPGVGSDRAPVALLAGDQVFVGPDNGLFELISARSSEPRARAIDLTALGLSGVSRTFHGRDVFAPVAARLAAGTLAFDAVGPLRPLSGKLGFGAARRVEGVRHGTVRLEGEVLVVDHFGNLISNIEPARELTRDDTVALAGRQVPCGGTYADVAIGSPIAYTGSFGQLEIGVREGSAATLFGAARGAAVSLEGRA